MRKNKIYELYKKIIKKEIRICKCGKFTNLVLDKYLDGVYDEEQIELIMNSLLTIKSRLRVIGINKSSLVKLIVS